ncbi:MAG TPA: flavodoxin domain-containing protein [Paludibacter sp.]|nr:flavodoxin domain-containing protein [Paludibacter sp.]
MSKALIIYHSKRGTTKKFSNEIAEFYKQNGIQTKVIPVSEFKPSLLEGVDHLLLGCWTQGHLIFNQHPAKEWVDFAGKLPVIFDKKIVLFTTYKVATGSMFRKMKEQLVFDSNCLKLELKSRNGRLNSLNTELLKNTITL